MALAVCALFYKLRRRRGVVLRWCAMRCGSQSPFALHHLIRGRKSRSKKAKGRRRNHEPSIMAESMISGGQAISD